MDLAITVPCRVNILGNPSDANEGDGHTITAAIERRAGGWVTEARDLTFETWERAPDGFRVVETAVCPSQPDYADGRFLLHKAAVNVLCKHSPEFRGKFAARRVRVATYTDVPRQSGLAGSSALLLVTLLGLRAAYALDPWEHNDYVMAELCQRAESLELGITCGFADRYAPIFGDIAYLDYRGKLYHRPLNEEPYVTYEKLGAFVPDLPLVVASTGVTRDSGDVHKVMRARYLDEHARWSGRHGERPFMVSVAGAIAATAWRGKIALLRRDWETFGALMNENHARVGEMMRACGYEQGAGRINDLFISTALDAGALGAKLTGAGGGGSVFALTRPGEEPALIDRWRDLAGREGLAATIFKAAISPDGARVTAGAAPSPAAGGRG